MSAPPTESQLQDLFLLYCNEHRDVKHILSLSDGLRSARLGPRSYLDKMTSVGFRRLLARMDEAHAARAGGRFASMPPPLVPRTVEYVFMTCVGHEQRAHKAAIEITFEQFIDALKYSAQLRFRQLAAESSPEWDRAYEHLLVQLAGPLFEDSFHEAAGDEGEEQNPECGFGAADEGGGSGDDGATAITFVARGVAASARRRTSRLVLTNQGIMPRWQAMDPSRGVLAATALTLFDLVPIASRQRSSRQFVSFQTAAPPGVTRGGGVMIGGGSAATVYQPAALSGCSVAGGSVRTAHGRGAGLHDARFSRGGGGGDLYGAHASSRGDQSPHSGARSSAASSVAGGGAGSSSAGLPRANGPAFSPTFRGDAPVSAREEQRNLSAGWGGVSSPRDYGAAAASTAASSDVAQLVAISKALAATVEAQKRELEEMRRTVEEATRQAPSSRSPRPDPPESPTERRAWH